MTQEEKIEKLVTGIRKLEESISDKNLLEKVKEIKLDLINVFLEPPKYGVYPKHDYPKKIKEWIIGYETGSFDIKDLEREITNAYICCGLSACPLSSIFRWISCLFGKTIK